jgi:putative CRISPR-associated protein (TIGR02619 family)
MRHTLICTVGTSLFNNLKNVEKVNDLTKSEQEEIKKAFVSQNWQQLVLLLLQQKNSDRICGAEINSITSICDHNLIQEKFNLIFLVSETEDGKQTGAFLKQYYQHSQNPIKFKNIEFRILTGLRDDNIKIFKQEGLKNLVKEISQEIRKFDAEAIAINATGGYKAQISFAGMIGQALYIPVYYMFEKFSEVIELPPQPIALDLAFWVNNYPLFEQLESENTIKKSEFNFDTNDEIFNSLLEQELDDDDSLISLSAMGILFNERSRLQFAKQETTLLSLIPQDDTLPSKKAISLRDDHGKDILLKFAQKICHSPYVKSVINSLPFNPKQVNPIKKNTPNGIIELVLTSTDKGLGLCIQTTGRNLAETNTIALHLETKYF